MQKAVYHSPARQIYTHRCTDANAESGFCPCDTPGQKCSAVNPVFVCQEYRRPFATKVTDQFRQCGVHMLRLEFDDTNAMLLPGKLGTMSPNLQQVNTVSCCNHSRQQVLDDTINAAVTGGREKTGYFRRHACSGGSSGSGSPKACR